METSIKRFRGATNKRKLSKVSWLYEENMKDYQIIYVCKSCEGECQHGAIICPSCHRTDPKVKAIGVR